MLIRKLFFSKEWNSKVVVRHVHSNFFCKTRNLFRDSLKRCSENDVQLETQNVIWPWHKNITSSLERVLEIHVLLHHQHKCWNTWTRIWMFRFTSWSPFHVSTVINKTCFQRWCKFNIVFDTFTFPVDPENMFPSLYQDGNHEIRCPKTSK